MGPANPSRGLPLRYCDPQMPQDSEQTPWRYEVPKKSRNGCQQCKKRKVKCNEQGPRCRNCQHRNTPCSFESQWTLEPYRPSSMLPPSRAVSVEAIRSPEPTQHSANRLPVNPLNLSLSAPGMEHVAPQDYQLMHHYTTIACRSFIDYDIYKHVWEVDVPREAQSQQFLMHQILAISALHLNHLWPSEHEHALTYKEASQKHYNNAVALFRANVPEISKKNMDAVFAFSHLSIFFAFGSSKFSSWNKPLEDPISELLDIFVLIRKGMMTVRLLWDSIQKSPMGILLQRGPEITDRRYLPVETTMALELMEQHCMQCLSANTLDTHTTELYRKAISQLWDSYVMTQTKRKDWGMALRFAIIIPEEFLGFLRQRDPPALILLAHFCVVLHEAPSRWWAEGWSFQVIAAIFESLPQDWKYAVSWPMKVVGLEPITSGPVI